MQARQQGPNSQFSTVNAPPRLFEGLMQELSDELGELDGADEGFALDSDSASHMSYVLVYTYPPPTH